MGTWFPGGPSDPCRLIGRRYRADLSVADVEADQQLVCALTRVKDCLGIEPEIVARVADHKATGDDLAWERLSNVIAAPTREDAMKPPHPGRMDTRIELRPLA